MDSNLTRPRNAYVYKSEAPRLEQNLYQPPPVPPVQCCWGKRRDFRDGMIGRRLQASRTLQIKFSRFVNIELGGQGGGGATLETLRITNPVWPIPEIGKHIGAPQTTSTNKKPHVAQKRNRRNTFCICDEGPAMFPSSVAEPCFF